MVSIPIPWLVVLIPMPEMELNAIPIPIMELTPALVPDFIWLMDLWLYPNAA